MFECVPARLGELEEVFGVAEHERTWDAIERLELDTTDSAIRHSGATLTADLSARQASLVLEQGCTGRITSTLATRALPQTIAAVRVSHDVTRHTPRPGRRLCRGSPRRPTCAALAV